jgi:Transposase DDE domain/Insertion element 4 transposase N-terminal
MSHLQDDLDRLGAADAAAKHAHLDALQSILQQPPVQQIVAALGRSDRACPVVDDTFALFFVLALGLFPTCNYRNVARRLLPAQHADQLPSRATLGAARQRLGAEPLRWVAQHSLRPLADDTIPDAFYKGFRLLTLDGFCLAIPDTPDNVALFGRHANQHGCSGYPGVRVVALMEAATHATLDYELDAATASETVLATPLLQRLPSHSLLLWDRHFFSFDHLWRVLKRGAHVLGRLSKSVKPKLLRRLADGSYLAEIRSGHRSQFGTRGRLRIRLLPYRLADPSRGDPAEVQRLFTTLLDEQAYPATELIVLYHERWEQELANDEIKTHQLQRPVLRSQTPEGVEQEVAALLVAHHAVRRVMVAAAQQAGVPPRRISFVGALDVIQCRLPGMSTRQREPVRLRRWYAAVVSEVSREVLPERSLRSNPRVVKCARVKWPGKKTVKDKPPQPEQPFEEVIALVELSI